MDDVTPRVITQYLAWGIKSRRNQVPYSISAIATFFNWQIAERDRKTANPVVKTMHYRKEKRRNPRPLDQHEIALAWKILDSRGTNLQRLAFGIAIEGGLRIGDSLI
jgi:site-specific recombinase XerD